MQVKLKDGSIQHLQSDTAKALIKLNLAEAYAPPKVEVRHETSWAVRPGDRIEDYVGPPRINFHCPCGIKGTTKGSVAIYDGRGQSLRPGANKEYVAFILKHTDGSQEAIPDAIMGEFLRLYTAWKRRSRAPIAGRGVDLNKQTNPQLDSARFGIKSREVLLAEARAKTKG